jgi:hypothetical protein
MASFDEADLKGRLGALPGLARVEFAAACAARMIRPWKDALQKLGLADSARLPEAVESLRRYVRGGPASDWSSLAGELVSEIPDEDEMTTTSHAVIDDALAATAYALRTAATFDPQEATWAARRLYDATDSFAQRSLSFREYTPEIERALLQNPHVQRELQRQARDLEELEAARDAMSGVATLPQRGEAALD